MPTRKIIVLIALIILWAGQAKALMPEDVLVVYNSAIPESKEVAEYYALRRKVPAANLLGVRLATGETMSRDEYDIRLAPAVTDSLKNMGNQNSPRCILLVYGVPLRVNAPPLTKEDLDYAAQAAEKKKYCLDAVHALTKRVKEIAIAEEKTTEQKKKDPSGRARLSPGRGSSSVAEANVKESVRGSPQRTPAGHGASICQEQG